MSRGVRRDVFAYLVAARRGRIALELECGHEKEAVQRRASSRGPEIFIVWRQRYAFCKRCKP